MPQMSSSNTTVTRKRSYSSSTSLDLLSPLSGNCNPTTEASTSVDSYSNSSSSSPDKPAPIYSGKKKKQVKKQAQPDQLGFITTTTHRHQQIITDQITTTTISSGITSIRPYKTSSQRSVPAFLHKLFNMVEDPSTSQLIRWSKEGNSFLVEGHEAFASTVLPRFYKHNTFASFVRQLNMYDFHKVPHIQQGILVASNSPENEVWEFSNSHFQRNRPDLLVLVTRKRNRDRNGTADAEKVNLGSLVKEISAIRKHQTNINTDLRNLHRDNEMIWKKTLAAREKHQKHQQVISKILQFLTAVFSNERQQLDNILTDDYDGTSQLLPDYDSSRNNTFSSSNEGSGSSSDDLDVKVQNNGNYSGNDVVAFSRANERETYGRNSLSLLKTGFYRTTSPVFNSPSIGNDHPFKSLTVKSAQEITHDIDELQTDVETLAAQFGIDSTQFPNQVDSYEFSSNRNQDIISSASRNDKRKLFKLADEKINMSLSPRKQHNSPVQPISEFPASKSCPSTSIQPSKPPSISNFSNNMLPKDTVACNDKNPASNFDPSIPLPNYFCELLKSADPYHVDPKFTTSGNLNSRSVSANATCQLGRLPRVDANSDISDSPKINSQHMPLSSMTLANNNIVDTDTYTSFLKNNQNAQIDIHTTTTEATESGCPEEPNSLFRLSVLSHQQLQDQRFRHLQLQQNRHHSSRASNTTNSPLFMPLQEAYFQNQYPIATHPILANPNSPFNQGSSSHSFINSPHSSQALYHHSFNNDPNSFTGFSQRNYGYIKR